MELTKKELLNTTGGGWGLGLIIIAGIIFIIGAIDGYIRPLRCNS